ncbi:hypothetical protein RSK60_1440018 [Ralstonia solanacearum K60]|nr:hypothetical protein RSK60_1440018 [Ralstonia solanacearum K60]
MNETPLALVAASERFLLATVGYGCRCAGGIQFGGRLGVAWTKLCRNAIGGIVSGVVI